MRVDPRAHLDADPTLSGRDVLPDGASFAYTISLRLTLDYPELILVGPWSAWHLILTNVIERSRADVSSAQVIRRVARRRALVHHSCMLRNSNTPTSGSTVRRHFLARLRARATFANVMSTAAVFVALGGVAYATIPDAGTGLIHGCYSNSNGALRVVDPATSECVNGETGLNWNQAGQQGAPGQQGPPGPQGPKGDTGPAGPNHGGVVGDLNVAETTNLVVQSDFKYRFVAKPLAVTIDKGQFIFYTGSSALGISSHAATDVALCHRPHGGSKLTPDTEPIFDQSPHGITPVSLSAPTNLPPGTWDLGVCYRTVDQGDHFFNMNVSVLVIQS